MDKDQTLSTRQENLIELLITGTPWRVAIKEAGYSTWMNQARVLKSPVFRKELQDALSGIIAINGPAAVNAMESVLKDPTQAGSREKMKAASEFLDRSGLGKVEHIEVKVDSPNAMFILPPKVTQLGTPEGDQGHNED